MTKLLNFKKLKIKLPLKRYGSLVILLPVLLFFVVATIGQLPVTLAQDGDSEPPAVNFSTLSVSPQTVGVGDNVTVSATVTDNLSGVAQVEFFYRSPSGTRHMTFLEFYDEDGLLSVNFSKAKLIKTTDENGVWELQTIYVKDRTGNERWYDRDTFSNPWLYDFQILSTFGPEEKDVVPDSGSATVDFPGSDVVITIETDESGTISVTRYPSDFRSPPDGTASAGIYLNITPSASLQGKPATFTVGYSLPLPDGVDESTLKLYRWSGSAWTVIPDQVLDTAAKTITASVTGFSTFGVFGGSATEDGDTTRRGREITTRFSRIFDYSGTIDHEHKQSLISGVAGLVAAGEGKLGGTHDGMTRESSARNSYNSNAFYQITTAANALPGDYMRMVSAYTGGNVSAARSGIETNPGGTGSVKENAAASSDGKGTYSDYNATVETNDGKIIIESAVGSASISSKVEGTSFVHFSVTVDGGGQKTGWWDIP